MQLLELGRGKYWLLVAGGSLAILAFLLYRHHRMVDLYETILRGGTIEARAAAIQLAGYRGDEPTELLLRVASPRRIFLDNRQNLAVQLLAKRKDAKVGARLAEFLQPQSALSLRMAVATALLETECSSACIQSILHYLERLWWGEPNVEEARENDPAIRSELKREQDELISTLHRVLLQNERLTLESLTNVYGLGDISPSRFALHTVGVLHLTSACPALERLGREPSNIGMREEVRALIEKLQCWPGTRPAS